MEGLQLFHISIFHCIFSTSFSTTLSSYHFLMMECQLLFTWLARETDRQTDEICQAIKFDRRITLHRHKTRFHTCNTCGKSLSASFCLRRHEMINSGNKPYKCKYCPKTFVEKQHLTYHVRIHTGEKPYSCRTCGKAFTQHGTLHKYLRTHNKNRPHKCQFCDKSVLWTETVDELFIDAFWKQREVIHVKNFFVCFLMWQPVWNIQEFYLFYIC